MEYGDIEGLFSYLKHGDEEHNSWLKEAIEAYYYGRPIPKVRGSGNKEKLIKELQDKLLENGIN